MRKCMLWAIRVRYPSGKRWGMQVPAQRFMVGRYWDHATPARNPDVPVMLFPTRREAVEAAKQWRARRSRTDPGRPTYRPVRVVVTVEAAS